MAEVTRFLRFVAVKDKVEVGRLERLDDGTIRANPSGAGTAAGILRSHCSYFQLTAQEVFTDLAANGWSNGTTMIHLDDLGPRP